MHCAKKNIIFVLLFFFLGMGCGSDAEKIDPMQVEKLTAVRKILKIKLGESYDRPVSIDAPLPLSRGKELYIYICTSCHGKTGEGIAIEVNNMVWKPMDFSDKKQMIFFSARARLEIIKSGIKDSPMMGWSDTLSEPDILAIFAHIESMR